MPNKRGGWKNVQELIKGEVLIRMSRVEKVSKINKRDTPYIRQVRVIPSTTKAPLAVKNSTQLKICFDKYVLYRVRATFFGY